MFTRARRGEPADNRYLLATAFQLQLRDRKALPLTVGDLFAAPCMRQNGVRGTAAVSEKGWPNGAAVQASNLVLRNSTHDPQWLLYFGLCFSF